MDVVEYQSRPALRHPVLIAAFGGWNDAGESATTALGFLGGAWGARPFAEIDPEEFFDFQVTRPQVSLTEGIVRKITWPQTVFSWGTIPEAGRDAVLLAGTEPSMRWRTFCEAVLSVAREAGVEMVVTLGALLADVPHSRPVRVTGTAADPGLAERLGLETSRYEGPTGIVGILHDACRAAGLPSASLWAAVPHYVRAGPSPKAALELVRRLGGLLDFAVDTRELEEASREYEQRVAAAVEEDADVAAYVRMLESRSDEEEMRTMPTGEDLAAELERFLRGLKGDEGR
jgi:proteasome assembly chaperone (PAC2) family protein